MSRVFITDEINDSYTADVYADGCLKAGQEYSYARIPSGTASGKLLADGKYLLHTVIFANTGSGILVLGDVLSACASAVHSQLSASALAFYAGSAPFTQLVDAVFSQGMAYRLTGTDTDGITVTYKTTA